MAGSFFARITAGYTSTVAAHATGTPQRWRLMRRDTPPQRLRFLRRDTPREAFATDALLGNFFNHGPFSNGPILENRMLVRLGPLDQSVDVRKQAETPSRKPILDTRRDLGKDFTRNQTVGLEHPQRDGQHPVRNILQRTVYLVESHGSIGMKRQQDQHRPLVPDSTQNVTNRATSRRRKFFQFFPGCIHLLFSKSYIRVTY